MSKRKTITIIIIVALLLIVLACGVYFFLNRPSSKEDNSSKSSGTSATSSASKPADNTKKSSPKTTCPAPTLTSDESYMLPGWKSFENSKYSFKYPETWTITVNESNFVNLKDSEADINFAVRSGSKAEEEVYLGYAMTSTKDITVNCRSARRDFIRGPSDKEALYVPVFKEGNAAEKDYTITIDYVSVGASISSDIVEAFDLILKTFEFK